MEDKSQYNLSLLAQKLSIYASVYVNQSELTITGSATSIENVMDLFNVGLGLRWAFWQ